MSDAAPDQDHEFADLCGWTPDAASRPAVQATIPELGQAGPWLAADRSKSALLYKCWKEVFADYPDYPAQEIGDCLHAGTMVLGETIKPIEQVKVGDMVWTGEGKLARVNSTRTLRTIKPSVEIRTKGGLPITCTADHLCLAYRVAVVGGKRVTRPYYDRCVNGGPTRHEVIATYEAMAAEWVPAGDLTPDHYLLSPASYEQTPAPDDPILSPIWASPAGRDLLGYFVGDGCASGGSVEFCVVDHATSDRLIGTLIDLGFDPKVDGYGKETKAWRIRVHSRALVGCLRRHFYDADGVKVFPGWAIGDPDFIDGLYDADGCKVPSGKSISSTSRSVIYGLLASLRHQGANPIVAEPTRGAGVFDNARPLYVVTWSDERQRNVIWRDQDFVCHRVKSVAFIEGPATVHDIGVSDAHHSFVANGFAVHNCESFGHAHAHDLLMTVEAYLGDLPTESIRRTCTEAFYGMGREAGNMLGGGDGCYGSAMLKAATTMGVVCYADLPTGQQTYSGRRAKQWGRSGAPADVKAIAAGRKLQGAMLTSVDDMIAALQAGHPCTISTGHGFTMTRDNQGFCSLRGRWGHCMAVVGYRHDRPGFLVLQSWGPTTPSGPLDLDQPTFSFWADLADMERIIAEQDSDTLSASPGFVPRSLPYSLSVA